jgi:hypothetical protein
MLLLSNYSFNDKPISDITKTSQKQTQNEVNHLEYSRINFPSQSLYTPLWNHIEKNFKEIGVRYLRFKEYENSKPIAFNGRIIIEVEGSFINRASSV